MGYWQFKCQKKSGTTTSPSQTNCNNIGTGTTCPNSCTSGCTCSSGSPVKTGETCKATTPNGNTCVGKADNTQINGVCDGGGKCCGGTCTPTGVNVPCGGSTTARCNNPSGSVGASRCDLSRVGSILYKCVKSGASASWNPVDVCPNGCSADEKSCLK